MKRTLKPLLVCLVIAFAALGVHNIVSTKNQLEFRKVEVKSKESELKELQLKYDKLNIDLDHTDARNKEQVKKLQEEKKQLEQEKADLEQQVSAKREAQRLAAQRLQNAASLSAPAYAASDPNSDKMFIYQKESGNNPGAINPSSGACGLGQALPCSKMPCSLSDYACQDNFFTGYMKARYGTWANAKAFWLANHWW